VSEKDFNKLMVRMELQADFLAGVWAHYANLEKDFLESGDIEEGMNAASAVGDDRIMKQTQGYVVPDAFTHGTSEQRVAGSARASRTGDIARATPSAPPASDASLRAGRTGPSGPSLSQDSGI